MAPSNRTPIKYLGAPRRLGRPRRIIDTELEATFAQHGLNGPDFAALVTLRRLEQPDGVPQSRLMCELNLTSGTHPSARTAGADNVIHTI